MGRSREGGDGNRSGASWAPAGVMLLALLLLAPTFADRAAAADPAAADPAAADRARVSEIFDGDTLALADGRRVRLAGTAAPNAPLGRPDAAKWPLADAARTALSEIALGRVVELRLAGAPSDRYGRTLAQLYRDDGLWLQGEMLRRGLARVQGSVDSRARLPEMLALEDAARAARRGLWHGNYYAIRQATEAGRFSDSFQLVEGTIDDAAKVKGQVFLNFGADWRTAFTIHIARDTLRLFREVGRDPLTLKGARVRVRGWVRFDRRPMIDVTYPEQIESLGVVPAAR